MNPFRVLPIRTVKINPFKVEPEPEEELSEITDRLFVDPNGGEVIDPYKRAFDNYEDIPF